jgi:hypothetical protein
MVPFFDLRSPPPDVSQESRRGFWAGQRSARGGGRNGVEYDVGGRQALAQSAVRLWDHAGHDAGDVVGARGRFGASRAQAGAALACGCVPSPAQHTGTGASPVRMCVNIILYMLMVFLRWHHARHEPFLPGHPPPFSVGV